MGIGPVVPFPRRPQFRLPAVPAWGVLALVLLIWLAAGTYQVGPGEAGVVRRFGKVTEVTGPGLHWHLPWPVEQVNTVNVQTARRVEVGFRTLRIGPPAEYKDVPEESSMLTGDENIVHVEVAVQYQISDPRKYLFNVRDPEQQVRAALEASLRAVVGRQTIDQVLTTGKADVQNETLTLLQGLLDKYESGIRAVIVQLQDVAPPKQAADAFKAVASAREEKQRLINDAETYRNDVIPKARGEAEKVLREAEAFRAEQLSKARGDAARFLAILKEYQVQKEVNRTRMYLETMEQVLPGMEIYIVDAKTGGVVPYLPVGKDAAKGGTGR